MSTQTQKTATDKTKHAFGVGASFLFEDINAPGAYIESWSGYLLRVPEDGFKSGRSPLISLVGREPLFVTKISDNPYITLMKAREVASNLDLEVNF